MWAEQYDEWYDSEYTDLAAQEFDDAEFFDDEPIEDPGEEDLEYAQEDEEYTQEDEEYELEEQEQEEDEEFHEYEQAQEQEELPDEQQQVDGSGLDYEGEPEQPTQPAPVQGEVDMQSIPKVIVRPTSSQPQGLPDTDSQAEPPEPDVVVVPQTTAPRPQILTQTQLQMNQPQIQSLMQPQAALPQFTTSALNPLAAPPIAVHDTTAQDLSAVSSNVTAAVVGDHLAAQAPPSPSRPPGPNPTARNPLMRALTQSASTIRETTQVAIVRSSPQPTKRRPVWWPKRLPLLTLRSGVASRSVSQSTPRAPVLSAKSPGRPSPPTPALAAASAPPRTERTSPPRSSPPRGLPVAGLSSPLLSPADQPGILRPSVQPPPIEEHPEFEDLGAQSFNGFDSAEDPKITGLLQLVLNSLYRQDVLLNLVGDDAQYALDAIQKLLDSSSFTSLQLSGAIDPCTIPHRLRRLLLKLALKCDQLPRALFLPNIRLLTTDNYCTVGGFSDIFCGLYGTQRVAIKRLRAFQMVEVSKRPVIKQAFYHESITWRHLSHRHILSFLGIDDQLFPAAFCMVSPWMENGTVRHTIDVMKNDPMISNEVLFVYVQTWIRGIVLGLAYLHEENVVHGDLRCANILIDSDMEVRLADFGLSVFADGASNNYGSMRAGAMRWLAPEMIGPEEFGQDSSRPTFMSDIYSFACVLIELYTGKPAFADLSDLTVIRRVMSGLRPERPRFHGEALMSDTLWSLLGHCWSQHPSDRPTADHLVQRLSSMQSHMA